LETACAHEIYEASQAHNCYRFFVVNTESNQIMAQLLLTHWDVQLSSNVLDPPSSEMVLALQISYTDCTSNSIENQQSIKKWKDTFNIEILSLLESDCLSLLQILEKSSQIQKHRIGINGMKIAFFEKIL